MNEIEKMPKYSDRKLKNLENPPVMLEIFFFVLKSFARHWKALEICLQKFPLLEVNFAFCGDLSKQSIDRQSNIVLESHQKLQNESFAVTIP